MDSHVTLKQTQVSLRKGRITAESLRRSKLWCRTASHSRKRTPSESVCRGLETVSDGHINSIIKKTFKMTSVLAHLIRTQHFLFMDTDSQPASFFCLSMNHKRTHTYLYLSHLGRSRGGLSVSLHKSGCTCTHCEPL